MALISLGYTTRSEDCYVPPTNWSFFQFALVFFFFFLDMHQSQFVSQVLLFI